MNDDDAVYAEIYGRQCPACGLKCWCVPAYHHDDCKGCGSPYPTNRDGEVGGEG